MAVLAVDNGFLRGSHKSFHSTKSLETNMSRKSRRRSNGEKNEDEASNLREKL